MYLLLTPFAVCSGVRSVRTEQGAETSMDDVMITTCLVFYVNGKKVGLYIHDAYEIGGEVSCLVWKS